MARGTTTVFFDSFELITLNLTESNVDDNSVSSKPFEVNDMELKDLGSKLRRGRRMKDFQREILPSLASLSRHEILEDINIMEGVLRSREYRKFRAKMAVHGENCSAPVDLIRQDYIMKEGVCVSLNPRWDFKVHEAAQSSFRQARLFSCISDKNHKRSIQEVSLIAQGAVNEFRNLLTLLDGSSQSDPKRIRKGPLLLSYDINPVELMDCPSSMPQSSGCNLTTQPHVIRQLFPLQSIQATNSFIPTASFSFDREKSKSKANVDVTNCLMIPNLSLSQPSTSLLSLDGRGDTGKRLVHHSASETLASRDYYSMFPRKVG
ncbi:hypothetical protein GH714_008985 [Hevea brasiliensis]|uniref:Uncharacterized protein n=1 Tax=Hevea brasiliensis TaxID=3981 RepID=A0A6A6MGZ9_HEVBR|nr:hypothetical protein GH714_008985 [Hevea brasiliensis]